MIKEVSAAVHARVCSFFLFSSLLVFESVIPRWAQFSNSSLASCAEPADSAPKGAAGTPAWAGGALPAGWSAVRLDDQKRQVLEEEQEALAAKGTFVADALIFRAYQNCFYFRPL